MPKELFARIESALMAATIGGLDRLAVKNPHRWLALTPFLLSHQFSQAVMNPLPDFSQALGAKVTVDGLQGGILARQVPSLTYSAVDVKDSVNSQA